MPRRYKTQKRKRTGRRKKSFFKGFLFSAVVFSSILLFSAVGFLLFSPRFQISEVKVTGNKDIAANDIKNAAQNGIKKTFSVMGMDFSTESIFLSLGSSVSSLAQTFPEIQSISVKKNFPNGLSIQVTEKTPFAVWCEEYSQEKCYLVDKPGTFIKNYDPSDGSTASLIKIYERENIASLSKKDTLASLDKIEGSLNQQISATGFNLFQDKVTVDTNLSCKLMFVLDDTLDWQIEKLGIVLKNSQYASKLNTMSYVDLRFGNQAIIK
jgi:hypothetical protein